MPRLSRAREAGSGIGSATAAANAFPSTACAAVVGCTESQKTYEPGSAQTVPPVCKFPEMQGIVVLLKPNASGLDKIALNRANVSKGSMCMPGRTERLVSAPARPALKPTDSACSPALCAGGRLSPDGV